MSKSEISITTKDGNFMGYLSSPKKNGPGVIVIQEIFGVNQWLRNVCDNLAEKGFFALAPDLFWRLQPGIQLDPTDENDFNKGLELYGKFNVDQSIKDIQSSIDTLRNIDGCSGKVGSVGYCLGGLLTYLTAARTDVNASSGYYGVGIEGVLEESKKIESPLQLHFAEKDSFVPLETAESICNQLEKNNNVTTYIYPNCDHGFARDTDPSHYDSSAADLANNRTLDLFRNSLLGN